MDVTSDDSVVRALSLISRPVDVLVNNAGLQHIAALEEFPIANWDFLVQVMLTGVARVTRAVLPSMREQARNIGAELDLWSRPGVGTEMELRIPATVAYADGTSQRRRRKLPV